MVGRLEGKIAVITGAGGGIGSAAARRFGDEGATVIVAEFNPETGAAAAAAAVNAHFIALDAGDEQSWRELIAAVLERFGRFDILVNNAAARRPLTIEETDLESWRDNQRVTSEGVFLGLKMVSEFMMAGGAVVNISSLGAFVGLPASFPYSAAKGAVRAMSRSAALHFATDPRQIRVNVIAPGATLTDVIRQQTVEIAAREGSTSDAILAKLTSDVPMKRMAHPLEVANAILFLASDEASFITGAELLVDGGATAI